MTMISESFTRIFVLTSLNQRIYFNILVTDENDDDDDDNDKNDDGGHNHHYDATTTITNNHNQNNTNRLSDIEIFRRLYHRQQLIGRRNGKFSSLYVPSQIVSHVTLNDCKFILNYSKLLLLSCFCFVLLRD